MTSHYLNSLQSAANILSGDGIYRYMPTKYALQKVSGHSSLLLLLHLDKREPHPTHSLKAINGDTHFLRREGIIVYERTSRSSNIKVS